MKEISRLIGEPLSWFVALAIGEQPFLDEKTGRVHIHTKMRDGSVTGSKLFMPYAIADQFAALQERFQVDIFLYQCDLSIWRAECRLPAPKPFLNFVFQGEGRSAAIALCRCIVEMHFNDGKPGKSKVAIPDELQLPMFNRLPINCEHPFASVDSEVGPQWKNVGIAEDLIARHLESYSEGAAVIFGEDIWFLVRQEGKRVLAHAWYKDGVIKEFDGSRHDRDLSWVDITLEDLLEYETLLVRATESFKVIYVAFDPERHNQD